MTARECASMLRNNRIFQSVGEDRLEQLVENADMQTFRRGDEILSPSRGGRIMGMIIMGSAAVNKGRAVINTLVPGDIFGAELSSLTSRPPRRPLRLGSNAARYFLKKMR